MNWFIALMLYAIIWWTALFIVLPIGTHAVAEADEVTGWRGAPAAPRMWRKVMWTTILTTVIWLICVGIITSGWISFRSGVLYLPDR